MKTLKRYSLVCILFLSFQFNAQTKILDSLNNILNTSKNDSLKFFAKIHLYEQLGVLNVSSWDSLLVIANKLNYPIYQGTVLNNLGYVYQSKNQLENSVRCFKMSIVKYTEANSYINACHTYYNLACCYRTLGNYEKAIETYNSVIYYSKILKEKKHESYCYNDIAIINYIKGNIPQTIMYFEKCIQIQKNINDYEGTYTSYNNIATIYLSQGEIDKALAIYKKCLLINKKNHNKKGVAITHFYIAKVYVIQKKYKEALNLLNACVIENRKDYNKANLANTLQLIGNCYVELNEIKLSKNYFLESLTISINMGDIVSQINNYNYLHQLEYQNNNLNQAKIYANKALTLTQQISNLKGEKDAQLGLYKINKKLKKYFDAYDNFKKYNTINDSLQNKAVQKTILQSITKMEFEKKVIADSLKANKNKQLVEFKIKQQQSQKKYLNVILLIILAFTIYIFNKFIVIKKQKKLIHNQKSKLETQKQQIQDKQNEILSSIRYAKRIQQSLLPTNKFLKSKINN